MAKNYLGVNNEFSIDTRTLITAASKYSKKYVSLFCFFLSLSKNHAYFTNQSDYAED